MSKDEARKLLGGYATGSLTEAERTALFQAALEDQELFDELAGEQVLKEVLDQPGARQRLIAALEPQKERAWIWAWGGAAATLAIVMGVVMFTRTTPPEQPTQIAQVLKSSEPMAPPVAAPVPRKPKIAQAPAPPPVLKEETAAVADQIQEAKPQAAKPQAAAGALRQFAAARSSAGFALSYAIREDGFLEIIPAASGFLLVTANDVIIFPGSAVVPGTPVRVAIPPGATSLVIGFGAMPGIVGAPVDRDETSGTVTDQDPPNGRITVRIPATR